MNRFCPFCEKVVNSSPHIYYCSQKTTEEKSEIKFLFLKKNFPDLSEKCVIEKVYETKSLPDIKKSFDIDFKSFIFLLDYFGIKKRNISESYKLISKTKYRKTCQDRYGVDNVSKSELIKNRKKETFLKNYGVDNIFKDDSFKRWILDNNFAWNNLSDEGNAERVKKQTESIKKYWNNLTDEQKAKIHTHNGTSSLESKISEALNYMSISYSTQFPLRGKVFDFLLRDSKILIEVNGDYWHCNPSIYKQDDLVSHPSGKIKALQIWKKDEDKRLKAESEGYKVIYIWEKEIKESEDIYKLIQEKIQIK